MFLVFVHFKLCRASLLAQPCSIQIVRHSEDIATLELFIFGFPDDAVSFIRPGVFGWFLIIY